MPKAIDLTGQQFHFLTAIRRAENSAEGKARWVCRCVCGKEVTVAAADLKKKKTSTKSCGCMRSKLLGEARTTHGMSHHPAWGVWHSMKQRCLDPNHRAYHNYGGRGIKVCERWLESFENFWADMGSTWQKGLDLDRIDNNGNYSPENCRWTTRRENVLNQRRTAFIDTPQGRLPISVASEMTGIGATTLYYRKTHGWPKESMLATPDYRHASTTSGIVVRGTDSQSGTEATH